MKFYLFLLITLTISCKRVVKNEMVSLIDSGKFYMLDTYGAINPYSENIDYYFDVDGNKEWLFYNNMGQLELIIYGFPDGKIIKRIKFERRGPDGILSLRGVHVHNLDSIFLVSGMLPHQFFLTDTTGIIKKRFELPKVTNNELKPLIRPLFSMIRNVSNIEGSLINLSTHYPVRPVDNKLLPAEIIDFSFCLHECTIEMFSFYPEFDFTYQNDLSKFSRAFNGNEYVYSFDYLDDIYIQNSSGEYRKVSGRSKYRIKRLDNPRNIVTPIHEQMSHMIKNPMYFSLLYDKYRRCYYRFFYPGYDVKSDDDITKEFENRKQFSIMVLCDEFNIIGETMMPQKTYNFLMSFIAEDGLYLALHCDHPKYDPDRLMFERLDLMKTNESKK